MAEAEVEPEELEEDYEQDLIDSGLVGILDMLNFKIVAKEPGDSGFSEFNAAIPPESRLYAAEYVRLKDEYDKLKKEMTDMASSSELQVRQELVKTKEALERERKVVEETKEALLGAQMEAEESKEALARAQTEGEEAHKAVSEEQAKVENLREMVTKMQEQLNEGEKKNHENNEKQERLERLINSTNMELQEAHLKIVEKEKEVEESRQVIEKLRKQNAELDKNSRLDKENSDKFQKDSEKLEEDLRILTATNSQLQEKSSRAEATTCELQIKLDTLQEKFTEIEDKLKEEIRKCAEYKTALEDTTSKVNTQLVQLTEAAEIMSELKKASQKYDILKTQFQTVVELNLGLDEQVANLQRQLREKSSEVENVQRDLDFERNEKIRMQTKLTRYRETLQSCNLELTQFIEELKNTIGFTDEGVDPCPSTLQSRLESLSVNVKSKLKSREDNLKELQAELTQTKQTIVSIHEHLRRQSAERIAMPPPPAPRRVIMPPQPAIAPRMAIRPPPQASSSDINIITCSYRDICCHQEQEASTETILFSDFDFPSLEISHGIINKSFGEGDFGAIDREDDIEEVTLMGCRECGRTFPTWSDLYQHQKTVHTVQMSKKVVQRRATIVKSLFGTFSTKQKKNTSTIKIKQRKKEAISIPKIKIKQRRTRNSAHWNIVAPSPAPSTIRNDGNQNENTLTDERMLSPAPEPFDQDGQNDGKSPSSSNPNVETQSPQNRPPLSEVSNSTAVGSAVVNQPQQHGIDETKSLNGSFCLCGQKCKDKYQLESHIKYYTTAPKFSCKTCGLSFKKSSDIKRHLTTRTHKRVAKISNMVTCSLCRQKFCTKEQLRRHRAAIHPPNPQPPQTTANRSQPDCQQNVEEGSQNFIDDSSNNINSSATRGLTTSTSKNHERSAAELHGVDTSKQDQGAFCICGGQYSSKANLDLHIGYFTLDWKFECGICSQRFYYLTYLRRHYSESHQEPNILDEYVMGCKLCGDMFRSRPEYHIHYQEHLRSKANEKKLKNKPHIHIDKRQSTSSQVTTSSKKTHYQDILKEHLGLFCVCGFRSVDENSLTKHIEEYSGDKKFGCNVCHQKFKLLSNLQIHLKVAHNAKKVLPLFGCQHCGKIFLQQSELLNHDFRDHPSAKRKVKEKDNSTSTSKPTPDGPAPPQSCSQHNVMDIDITRIKVEKTDPELVAIRDHGTTKVKHGIDHSKARLGFYCKCGFKSSRQFAKYNLQKHIKYFKAKSYFECPQCQLSFKSTHRLRCHMRSTHNLDYTLKGCSICGNVFENIEALREHKKSQHRKKRKRIEQIDLINVPTSPQNAEEDMEELQQNEDIIRAALTIMQKKILPSSLSPTKKASLSLSSQNTLPLSALPKKKHEKDMSKRHLGFFCVCGTKTRTATALHGHIAYFTLDKKFECELCGHRSLYLAQLKQHLKSTHKLTNYHQLNLMGMGCSLCGETGFTTLKELAIHKVVAHSVLNDPNGQSSSRTGSLTDCVEPQPSTSKCLQAPTDDRRSFNSGQLKNPSIIISTRSLSITPVVSSSTSSLPETSRTPAYPLNLNQADIRHAIDKAKLNAGLCACICGYTTNNRVNLWAHIHYKTAEKKFACPFCNKKFIYMSHLRKHTKRSHKRQNPDLSGCAICSKVFSSKKELLKHSLSMHTQPKMAGGLQVPQQPILKTSPTAISSSAIIQSASSSSVWIPVTPSISVSLRTPRNDGPGDIVTFPGNPSSSHVELSSSTAAGGKSEEDMIIDAHLTYEPCTPQVHHEINHEMLLNGFYCICGQDFDSANALNRHVKIYSSGGKFICKTCGHAFLFAAYLRNHMLKVHKIVYNISNGCKHCGKNFPTNMQLYEHFRVEHNNGHIWEPREQKYTPPTTSQAQLLSQESSLPYSQEQIIEIQDQNAQQKSLEEKHGLEEQDPLSENNYFSCKCGVRFSTLTLLKGHIRENEKRYIFKCYICPATFKRHCNLKEHVVKVHKVTYDKGKYSCGVCAETFETCERMKTHKKDIHGIS